MSAEYFLSGPVRRQPLLPIDDDLPFDTFDRELLAELTEQQSFQDHGPSSSFARLPSSTQIRHAFRTPAGDLTSQFVGGLSAPITTPVVGQELSSSDTGDLQSSPLLRYFKPNKPVTSTTSRSLDSRHRLTGIDEDLDLQNSPSTGKGHAYPAHVDLPHQISLTHAPPIVQGISLISTQQLPDRFRSLFPFPLLNAVQSKCFPHVYQDDCNVVVSAPTGSGKTVIMELAICRLVNNLKDGLFKVIYQAPTRSLCSERFRDWSTKFTSLGLQCAELTGDTEYSQLRAIQTASIIVTTPEKWDSMTRKWRDHSRLMQLVKLFLIDEVHVLNESRGAALEAVVSRMKSVGSNVRFLALSATIPNSEDIATWLGKSDTFQHLPAHREHFGEEFRPTKLQKIVYGYQCNGNDFAFDRFCGSKLPEIISKHSKRKPVMIFCCTRNSAIATAKDLAKLWTNTIPRKQPWPVGPKIPIVKNPDLKAVIGAGVAFHHAGLESDDRYAVENSFLKGQISIICCTSTLAVGVNLPCYLVIIKNTVCWQDGGCKEYSDLEMMQMLGRAGRPQFDDSAVAVILTKKDRLSYYEKLVSGTEQLESCLHLNLIDHLNAEIGLGTIGDLESATKWLAGTFLFVRLRRNPTHYKLKENADRRDEDEMLRQVCEKDVKLLQECGLVTTEGSLKSTPYGDAMAKYYVKFETMKILLALPPRAKVSEILSAISQADEFREIRLKAPERPLYREINRCNGIRFPIRVDLSQHGHKVSLLIQSELGASEFPSAEQYQKHKFQLQQDKTMVFTHINRLLRCVVDCQIHNEDGIAVRNALELSRSFAGRAWENSPLQMKQIDQIGIVAVRRLASAGITSIQELEETEAHRIDTLLSKNPPFGTKLLSRLADFPKLRVTIKMIGKVRSSLLKDIEIGRLTITKASRRGKSVSVNLKADIGFLNEKLPAFFQKRPVYVCSLVEISGGRLVDFRRMSAQKLQNGHEIFLSAELTSSLQHITCYVMCDDIGGTSQYAKLKPDIPVGMFPKDSFDEGNKISDKSAMNTSRRRSNDASKSTRPSNRGDVFEDDDFADDDFLAAAEDFDRSERPSKLSFSKSLKPDLNPSSRIRQNDPFNDIDQQQPAVLVNGKYKCNHKCKDKSACKHFCCREGLDKPPKVYKKGPSAEMTQARNNQLSLVDSVRKKNSIDLTDLSQPIQPRTNTLKHIIGTNPLGCGVAPSKATRMANLDLAVSQPAARKLTFEAGESVNKKRKRKLSRNRRESSSEYGDSDLEKFFAPIVILPQPDDQTSVERYDPAVEDAATDGTIEGIDTDFEFVDDTKRSATYLSTPRRTSDSVSGFLVDSKDRESPSISQTPAIQSPEFPTPTNRGSTQQTFHSNDAMEREDAVKRYKVSETVEENLNQSLLEEFGDIVNFTGILKGPVVFEA